MDKLMAGFFKELGGVLVKGDGFINNMGIDDEFNPCNAEHQESMEYYVTEITSFAPRLNSTGMQPCADDMPVVCGLAGGEPYADKASGCTWINGLGVAHIDTWKPDLEALIKQQSDADKDKVLAKLNEVIEPTAKLTSSQIEWLDDDVCAMVWAHSNKLINRYSYEKEHSGTNCYIVMREATEAEKDMADGALSFLFNKQSDPWTNLLAMVKESQSLAKAMQEECERADNGTAAIDYPSNDEPLVYTQEMFDAGELPKVGMLVSCVDVEVNNRFFDSVEVLFISDYCVVIKGDTFELAGSLRRFKLKPIETPTAKERCKTRDRIAEIKAQQEQDEFVGD